jgi:hypothetical protein
METQFAITGRRICGLAQPRGGVYGHECETVLRPVGMITWAAISEHEAWRRSINSN